MGNRDIVPYSFDTDVLPQDQSQAQPLPGQYMGIHLTIADCDCLVAILEKIERWFEDRDEVILIDHGETRRGRGFLLMEWEECTIDQLFLDIVKHDGVVEDYSVYTRDIEVQL